MKYRDHLQQHRYKVCRIGHNTNKDQQAKRTNRKVRKELLIEKMRRLSIRQLAARWQPCKDWMRNFSQNWHQQAPFTSPRLRMLEPRKRDWYDLVCLTKEDLAICILCVLHYRYPWISRLSPLYLAKWSNMKAFSPCHKLGSKCFYMDCSGVQREGS